MKIAFWTHIPRVAPEIGTELKITNFHWNGLLTKIPGFAQSAPKTWKRAQSTQFQRVPHFAKATYEPQWLLLCHPLTHKRTAPCFSDMCGRNFSDKAGIEPALAILKTAVLPLNDSPSMLKFSNTFPKKIGLEPILSMLKTAIFPH